MTGTRFGIETVREAVRRRVAETSLRQVAEEIPMSFSGLRSFMKGGAPQPATREKLIGWYTQSGRKRHGDIAAQDVAAAVELLRQYVAQAVSETGQERRRQRLRGELGL